MEVELRTNSASNSVVVTAPMKYIEIDGDGTKHVHKTESIAACRERMNQVQVKSGCNSNSNNDKSKKLTAADLIEAYERKGRPFYDP
jgi:hypothetical protein